MVDWWPRVSLVHDQIGKADYFKEKKLKLSDRTIHHCSCLLIPLECPFQVRDHLISPRHLLALNQRRLYFDEHFDQPPQQIPDVALVRFVQARNHLICPLDGLILKLPRLELHQNVACQPRRVDPEERLLQNLWVSEDQLLDLAYSRTLLLHFLLFQFQMVYLSHMNRSRWTSFKQKEVAKLVIIRQCCPPC